MTTIQNIVDRALREIGITSEDESASDATLTNTVEALNFMASGWKSVGIDLSWTDKAATDTFPLDDEYREPFTVLLAANRARAYEVEAPDYVRIKDAWEVFEQNYRTTPEMTVPMGLKRLPSQYWGYGTRDE